MLACIEATGVNSVGRGTQNREIVIRRFREMLDANPLMPLHVPQMSQAISISGRTLRMACQNSLRGQSHPISDASTHAMGAAHLAAG